MSDSIEDWVIEAVVKIIIDYLDKFISLCFKEDFDPLVCSKPYIVLPELKKLVIRPANIDVKYIYIEEEIEEKCLDRSFNYCNLHWFYKSQLFYDGYSEQDYSSYTEYLDYIDLRDYNSYRNN